MTTGMTGLKKKFGAIGKIHGALNDSKCLQWETLHLSGCRGASVNHPCAEEGDALCLRSPFGAIMSLDWESIQHDDRGISAMVHVRQVLAVNCERCGHDQDATWCPGRTYRQQSATLPGHGALKDQEQ